MIEITAEPPAIITMRMADLPRRGPGEIRLRDGRPRCSASTLLPPEVANSVYLTVC
jgi:hypothetical protein